MEKKKKRKENPSGSSKTYVYAYISVNILYSYLLAQLRCSSAKFPIQHKPAKVLTWRSNDLLPYWRQQTRGSPVVSQFVIIIALCNIYLSQFVTNSSHFVIPVAILINRVGLCNKKAVAICHNCPSYFVIN